MAQEIGATPRTRFEMTRRLFGSTWLGPLATLEEYAAASWFENERVIYIYQAVVGEFRRDLHCDFLLPGLAPQIIIEVNGDKYHSGVDQQTADRFRALALANEGFIVIPVYGHDILGYPGHPVPTDASFDRIMRHAVAGIQLSFPT
jgi:very-short-patch-repair endonuclease